MSYLLDTNICSAHMRRPGGLAHRFVQHSGRLWISTIVLAELYAGAYLVQSTRILSAIEEILEDVEILGFDVDCAKTFGQLRGELKRLGIAASPLDLQIAAVALVHDLTLVTNNTADFANIPGLRIEDRLTR